MMRTCVVLLYILCFGMASAQSDGNRDRLVMHFENLTVHEKLPSQRVLCVWQDRRGMMWLGTEEGLCKYDGYRFKEYVADIHNPNSISNNAVRAICEDAYGHLWIGTDGGGLNYFVPEEERFCQIPLTDKTVGENDELKVYSLLLDNQNDLWVGSYGAGLFRIHLPESCQTLIQRISSKKLLIESYTHDPVLNQSIHDDHIFSLYQDHSGTLWVGTDDYGTKQGGALHRIIFKGHDREVLGFQQFRSEPGNPFSLGSNYIMSMYEDHNGNFWVCNWQGGLNLFDRSSGRVIRYQHNPADSTALNNNNVYTIVEDHEGRLWVGTYGGGMSLMVNDRNGDYRFIPFRHHAADPNSLIGNHVRQIYPDRTGLLWVITWKSGVSKVRVHNNPFSQIPPPGLTDKDTITDVVTAMEQLSDGTILVATERCGICRLDTSRNSLIPLKVAYHGINFSGNQPIQKIWQHKSGQLMIRWNNEWYPVQYKPDGISEAGYKITGLAGPLSLFKPFKRFASDTLLQHIMRTYRVFNTDSKGILWVGDGQSLYRLDTHSDTLDMKEFRRNSLNPAALKGYQVTAIQEDTNGGIWVATMDALNLLDPVTGQFTYYTMKDGLPGNAISGLLADTKGHFWLATDGGLVRFDPQLKRFNTFHKQDGLPFEIFNTRVGYGMEDLQVFTACKSTSDGRFILGSAKHGLLSFHPDSVFHNQVVPQIVITGLTVLNIPVTIGDRINGRQLLNREISYTDHLVLSYRERGFTLSFAALDYLQATDNLYRYHLDPFDHDWQMTDAGKRFARYSNLKPGVYHFQVTGTNNDGVWNNTGARLDILIRPPWWNTGWFRVMVVTVIVIILVISRILTIQRQRMLQELKLDKLKMKELDRFTQMRIGFYTNVTHEFRTPVSLILGPVQSLLEKNNWDPATKESLGLIRRNALRMLNLVNQLIDFRKLEKQALQLQVERDDLVGYTRGIANLFRENALSRNITFTFIAPVDPLIGCFDKAAIDKMVFNLLSNAFKFTRQNGSVTISVTPDSVTDPAHVTITVKDTGSGMTTDELKRIFTRFYQSDDHQPGSGIGLSIVKELTELHHGTILVDSKSGVGSVFRIVFPFLETDYADHERIQRESQTTFHQPFSDALSTTDGKESYNDMTLPENAHSKENYSLLLVEDHPDMRQYIRMGLPPDFLVSEVSNGNDALTWINNHQPDIILADVMMPGMGGFELTRRIKENIETSHIPVFLITALPDKESQLLGLQSGADDYIVKPFDLQLLVHKIQNQLKTHREFLQKFRVFPDVVLDQMPAGPIDKDFLNQLTKQVENHCPDPGFGVNELVASMGMSRSVLFRKIKSLTGMNINELITLIRIRKARNLLSTQNKSVKEIAYLVGFSDPKYFSTVFKKHFGISPSEIKKEYTWHLASS